MRYLQQRFIPSFAPDVKVLGVVIPTVEEALSDNASKVGVLATPATVRSHIYQTELHKIKPELEVFEVAAPKLVPAIEGNDFASAHAFAKEYVSQFAHIDSLILGCTHYPLLKTEFRQLLPETTKVVSQDELMGAKLKDYLTRHIEIDITLSRGGSLQVLVSQAGDKYCKVASTLFPNIKIEEAR